MRPYGKGFSPFRTIYPIASRYKVQTAMPKKKMAGAGGFEPPNAGSKDPCLSAWRRPNAISR
ncbi:hypothetical protein SBDP2_240009 [Syntrophobacter sp. SbD2]|nr:hypothetical protein SBDP2_240009 [Syntrophobacter sp. SbD2]